MRNIAEIIKDDRNGKQLSQTERQVAVAYIQGKYDAVRELKICNNSNSMDILDKIRANIQEERKMEHIPEDVNMCDYIRGLDRALSIIDEYEKYKLNKVDKYSDRE